MIRERWVVKEGIPGIATKDDVIIVRPDWGILVTRYLSMTKYPDLMKYRDLLSPLPPRRIRAPRPLRLLD